MHAFQIIESPPTPYCVTAVDFAPLESSCTNTESVFPRQSFQVQHTDKHDNALTYNWRVQDKSHCVFSDAVTARPDCYWGRNCRTQVKAHHAM